MLCAFQTQRSQCRRFRLQAGVLVLLFAFLSFLPWFHGIGLNAHEGHGCHPHTACAETPTSDLPSFTPTAAAPNGTCWICASLTSLHQPTVLAGLPSLAQAFFASSFFARAQQAPAHLNIYPAGRSQAPPVRA